MCRFWIIRTRRSRRILKIKRIFWVMLMLTGLNLWTPLSSKAVDSVQSHVGSLSLLKIQVSLSFLIHWFLYNFLQSPPSDQPSDTTKKGNDRSIAPMKIMAKILNKILVKQIQHVRRIIHHGRLRFTPEIQGWLNIHRMKNVIFLVNKEKNKSHRIIWIDAENFWKAKHL